MNFVQVQTKIRFLMFFLLTLYHASAVCDSSDHHCQLHNDANSVIGFYEERDLELFTSYDCPHSGIFTTKLNKPYTSFGKSRLTHHLKNPTADVALLQLRQRQLRLLLENEALLEQLQTILADIAQNEEGLINFIEIEEEPLVQRALESFYFQSNRFAHLNNSPAALDARNYLKYLGLLGPVVEHMLVHFGLDAISSSHSSHADDSHHKNDEVSSCAPGCKQHHHHKHHEHRCITCPPVSDHASPLTKSAIRLLQVGHFVWHAASVVEMVNQMSSEKAVMHELHNKIVKVQSCLSGIKQLYTLMKVSDYSLQAFGVSCSWLDYFDNATTEQQRAMHDFIDDQNFACNDPRGFFSRIGATLSYYRLLEDQLSVLQSLVVVLGDLDALVAIAQWYKDTNADKKQACLVNFVSSPDAPVVRIKNLWNIALDSHKAVSNDIELGAGKASHMIVTGPNKAGKSSLLKSLGLTIVLAQSFGIAAAESAQITPFNKLISYIVVVDDISHDKSTMIAEMIRADSCIQTIQLLGENQHACILIDDSLFKGTTIEKSQELTERFIRTLGSLPHCCSIIATHMPVLTKLGQEPMSNFKNYYIPSAVDRQGRSYSTFHLSEGVADLDAVFDIVKSEGYTLQ